MTQPTRSPALQSVGRIFVLHALKFGTLALIVFFGLEVPDLFLNVANAKQIALAGAILLIVACPQTVLILMGQVDLSVGSALGVTAVVGGDLIVHGFPAALAILIALLLGAFIGAINSFLCVTLGFSPVIVTIGMLTLLRGVAQLITVSPPTGFGSVMIFLGRGSVAGIPTSVWLAAIIFFATLVFLTRTPYGRHVYAIGVNTEASYLSGVGVKTLPALAFIASGLAAALGGILYAARLDSAPPASLGVGFEFDVLTVVLLGGIAFTGGRGNMTGVLVGAIFLGVLKNGLLLMNVSAYWQAVASGLALIAAAGLDRLSTRVLIPRRSRSDPAGRVDDSALATD